MTDIEWKQITPEISEVWQKAFDFSKKGMDVDNPCPVCGKFDLHRWYLTGEPLSKIIEGNRFIAQGELWEWCSSCGTFQHYSGMVPDWWTCDLDVDLKELVFTPDAIEEARRKRFG